MTKINIKFDVDFNLIKSLTTACPNTSMSNDVLLMCHAALQTIAFFYICSLDSETDTVQGYIHYTAIGG